MLREVSKSAKAVFKDLDLGKSEVVTGFATYNTPDRDKDIANQGMFAKSWQEFKDVRNFLNHDKTQAPGKILKLWDDSEHAYAHTKMGSHTLGQDVLKQIDEGIITDSSYVMIPLKQKSLTTGGSSFTEVFHKEVSYLTHWGAHPESKIKAVRKEAFSVIPEEVAKELNSSEMNFLRDFIGSQQTNLVQLVSFAATVGEDSDLYRWVHDCIGSLSYSIYSFKNQLHWYKPREKSWANEAQQRLEVLKSFIKNTRASDHAIKEAEAEARFIEGILKATSTQSSNEGTPEQQKGANDEAVNLQLLNLSMLF